MPAVFAAAFVGGMVDTAFLTFLPIWGLRTGLDHEFALALLSIFIIGNVVLPFPVGWLSDRIGIRPVMALCGAISVLGPLLAVYFAASPILLSIVLFIWGGAVFSLYSLAMTDIGHRCKGTSLAAASGALVVVYTISNISGPPLTGAAMQAWGVHSLMAVSAVVAAMFMVILALTARSASSKFSS
jgi:MFS family permease